MKLAIDRQDPTGHTAMLGPYQVSELSVASEGRITRTTTRGRYIPFSFILRSKGVELATSCRAAVHGLVPPRSDKPSSSNGKEISMATDRLSCDIVTTEDTETYGWKLRLQGTGPELGLQSGDVSRFAPELEIRSSHDRPPPGRDIGPLNGFEIVRDDRIVAFVPAGSEQVIQARSDVPEKIAPLLATAALALALYENALSGE